MDRIGRIDCHVHYMASRFADRLLARASKTDLVRRTAASRPAWRDLSVHRKLMADTGVTTSVILQHGNDLIEGLRSLGGDLNETFEAYNRSMSEDLAPTEGEFVATAGVDPWGGKEAVAQLDRSLQLPAIVAVGLTGNYDGIALDDPAFHPIYEVARHHDVPVMVHPTLTPSWVKDLRLDNQFLRTGLGFFLDDAMCLFRMATNGTFDRFPGVRFMFCQLGGVAPFCCGRWEYHRRQARSLQSELGEPLPSWANKSLEEYLGHIWLDTHTQDRHALRLVMEEGGDHVIVLGGDHPYTPTDGGVAYAMEELAALSLAPETLRKIERDNALALLGPHVGALPA